LNPPNQPSRRAFLAATGSTIAASAASSARAGTPPATTQVDRNAIEPFFGEHQGGIVTPAQNHTYFAAFDLVTSKKSDVVKVLSAWTQASARMSRGLTAVPLASDTTTPASDSGDALDLSAARLTLTFGFGAGLFTKDGKDRFGLAHHRPEALADLPKFNGDQLVEAQTGGDLSIQACADDPQVAFHAVRQLAKIGRDIVQIRWAQTGFLGSYGQMQTPRNLMGFKDGTNNPSDPKSLDEVVWVGGDGPKWMQGGSYAVVRRIRIALEHWDQMALGFQEQTMGRHKYSGAPLGKKAEFDNLDLDATDADGNSVIPENAHIRLATAATNDGARVLRRSYSYNDGVSFTSERWPPWRQGMEYDAGLLFVCYQRDPRAGFVKIFDRMAKFDMMNQFVTHVGGGLFACPGGIADGQFIGQILFDV
jgi:deferrochelatase/peroxidase EfeB